MFSFVHLREKSRAFSVLVHTLVRLMMANNDHTVSLILLYAAELRNADADLILMVQADMLAYHKAGEPAQLGLPDM
jgi:hypothetical protein